MDISNNDRDELNKLSMKVLIHAGNARNFMVQSLEQIENQDNYAEAETLIKQANNEIVIAHGMQTSVLQKEALGEPLAYSVLFCHAQDTLMTAQSEILIAKHLIKLFRTRTYGKKEAD